MGLAFKSHLEKGEKNPSMVKFHVFIVHKLLLVKNLVTELALVDNSNKNVYDLNFYSSVVIVELKRRDLSIKFRSTQNFLHPCLDLLNLLVCFEFDFI